MPSDRRAVLPTARSASSAERRLSKCTGRFFSVRLSEAAAFLRSCTKNADIVRNASSSLARATSSASRRFRSTDVTWSLMHRNSTASSSV